MALLPLGKKRIAELIVVNGRVIEMEMGSLSTKQHFNLGFILFYCVSPQWLFIFPLLLDRHRLLLQNINLDLWVSYFKHTVVVSIFIITL